jgi:amidase
MELAELDATAQAKLVRRREVTPLELVDAAIDRVERLNPRLNAVITPMFELARATARGMLPEGPFTGVPFLMKDLGPEYAGVGMTEGTAFLRGYVSPRDSELTLRYKRAGLIVIGKTNTCEFGILPVTEPRLFGPTRNPWDVERTPGGSSGGSAAAVASRMTPMAHGNDGGGSIRIPASCCGLVGLLPTRGRTPQGPNYGDIFSGLAQNHAVTRSVRDSARLLDATAGYTPGDPYVAPAPTRPFADEVGAEPGRLRIALMTETWRGFSVHADCVAAVREAAGLCERLGHHITEVTSPIDGDRAARAFSTVWSTGMAWSIDDWARRTGRTPSPDDFEPLTWALAEWGHLAPASDYLLAVTDLQRMARTLAEFMADYDVMLTPTTGEPPLPIGTLDSPPEQPTYGFKRSGTFAPFTAVVNGAGQPAISLPLYWSADGLPIGAHFIGRYGDEATLFRLASQIEAAQPWSGRRPPVCA